MRTPDESTWLSALARWKAVVEKFEGTVAELHQARDAARRAGRLAEWEKLDSMSIVGRQSVMQIARPLTQVYGWLTSMAQGMANLRDIAEELGMPMVPEIPHYVINGSSAAVALLTLRIKNFVEGLK